MARCLELFLAAFCLYSANCDRECRKYHRDTASCLASIRARATDAGLWWYGDTNVERCPPGDGSIECFNPRGLFGESLMSAVFGKDNFNIDQIDRYIDINFESEPGGYVGCDYNYYNPRTSRVRLDPTDDLKTKYGLRNWSLRHLVSVKFRAEAGKQYLLMLVDTGMGYINSIWPNIEGNNWRNDTVVNQFNSPLNPKAPVVPFAFFLFRQTEKNIEIPPKFTHSKFTPYMSFDVSSFVDQLGLQGPIAVNWIGASPDPYAASVLRTSMYNCLYFVKQKFNSMSIVDKEIIDQMDYFLSIEFTSTEQESKCCCEKTTVRANRIRVDPIGDVLMNTASVRTGTAVNTTFYLNKLDPGGVQDLVGKNYTLAMYNYGLGRYPDVHWMVVNIQDGIQDTGHVTRDYIGPIPRKNVQTARYYFILYEQSSQIPETIQYKYFLTNTSVYSCPMAGYRCGFDERRFRSEMGLRAAGVSWLRVSYDSYTQCQQIIQGKLPEEACIYRVDVRQCPAGTGHPTTGRVLVLVLLTLTRLVTVL